MSNTTSKNPSAPTDIERRLEALEAAARERSAVEKVIEERALVRKLAKQKQDKKPGLLDYLKAIGPIFIGLVGVWFTWSQQRIADRHNLWETNRQLHVSREQSDTDLRAKMFELLTAQFFTGSSKPKDKVLLLGLLENNFQDFNAGPLFALLNSSLNSAEDKDAMRKLAKAACERQELLLGAGLVPPITLAINQSIHVPVWVTNGITIKLLETTEDQVRIHAEPDDTNAAGFRYIDFGVSYFDMPMTDNTETSSHCRFAVTLKSIDTKEHNAVLKVIALNRDYLAPSSRPDVSSLTKKWKEQLEK